MSRRKKAKERKFYKRRANKIARRYNWNIEGLRKRSKLCYHINDRAFYCYRGSNK